MSVTLVTRPEKTINASIPQISRWGCAWLPFIFKFQRADYDVSLIASAASGGGIVLTIDGVDLTSEISVGDSIYFYDDGGYDGNYEVLDVSLISPTATEITIDATVGTTGVGATSFINITNRLGYFLEVRVLEYTTGSAVETTDQYARFRPDASGLIKADVSEWLQPLLSAVDEFDYVATSTRDENLGQPFQIQWREYTVDGGYTDWSTLDDDNIFSVANAVKQTRDRWGQNLGEYVLFPPDTASPPQQGSQSKFLTMFENPVYFEGYPFDLAYAVSKDYDNYGGDLFKEEQRVDAEGNELSISVASVSKEGGYVNRMQLDGSYDATVAGVYVTLRSNITSAYVDDGYVDLDYVDEIGATAIGEPTLVDIGETCEDNPIYLRWLNPVGGWDSWLFSRAQDIADVVGAGKTFEGYVEDIGEAEARKRVLSKDSQEEITLGASGLAIKYISGLRWILSSPEVHEYLGLDEDTGLPKWRTVIVKAGTFLIQKTDETRAALQFTIQPPEKYLQRQ